MKPSKSIPLSAALAFLSLVWAAASVEAAPTVYDNEADFTANLAADCFLNDFSGLPADPLYNPSFLDYTSDSWSYSVTTQAAGLYANPGGVPTGPSLGTNYRANSLIITFTGAPVAAVGGYFFAANFDGAPETSPTVTVEVTFANGTSMTITGASAATFTGIVGNLAIAKIEIKPTWGSGDFFFASVDHLYVGTSLGGVVLTGLQAWRDRYFHLPYGTGNADDGANPAHDGIVNLMKYAFGLDPTVAVSPAELPRPVLGESDFVLSFTEPAGISGITYHAEWSETLLAGSWSAIADTGTPPQHVFSLPTSSGPNIFMRIKVTNP